MDQLKQLRQSTKVDVSEKESPEESAWNFESAKFREKGKAIPLRPASVLVANSQRKPNMTDSEMKAFLKDIATVTETSCWVTDYSKNVNSKGQTRLHYKNKTILLHQLSHLLFNSDVSNLDSIFHNCSNLICFNPAHLTEDLKEKQFKLEMPSKELLEGCSAKDKKKILIDYGNWLSKELGRPLIINDFRVVDRVSYATIIRFFDSSMTNYFNSCDFTSAQRKSNMADSEMKEFLKTIKTVTETGCWITDYWKTSNPEGRIQIGYKSKLQFLYRVSYTLFKGSIPDGLLATHLCDNPPCFNPDHIFLDTHEGNMRQAAERGRIVSTSKKRKLHKITDPEDYEALLNFVKQHIEITEKNEWIFPIGPSQKYPTIQINKKVYQLHRLLLANKLEKPYDEIDVACHRLPDGSKPNKHDVNPDHLFEDTRRGNALDTAKYHKGYKLDIDKANQVKNAAANADFSKRGKTSFDKEWAAKLDVSRSCIRDVRLGINWKSDI